jgi:Na+-driven multidrug efflux pump
MNFKKVLISFAIGFSVTLVASSLVTYLYSLGFHETAKIDWENSFRLAIIFGIVFPFLEARKGNPKDK